LNGMFVVGGRRGGLEVKMALPDNEV